MSRKQSWRRSSTALRHLRHRISLYEMLTESIPSQNNMRAHLGRCRVRAAAASEYDPNYAPFDPVISKALAKDRDRRYSDAARCRTICARVVLPRRRNASAVHDRCFRASREEQKLLDGSDRQLAGPDLPEPRGPGRPRRGPRPPRSIATMPDLSAGGGGDAAVAECARPSKGPVSPSVPPRPSSPPRRGDAGDTLVDTDSSLRRGRDAVPGARPCSSRPGASPAPIAQGHCRPPARRRNQG